MAELPLKVTFVNVGLLCTLYIPPPLHPCRVAAEGDVRQRRTAGIVVHPAATGSTVVARECAARHRQGANVRDAATAGGCIARDCAVRHRQNARVQDAAAAVGIYVT